MRKWRKVLAALLSALVLLAAVAPLGGHATASPQLPLLPRSPQTIDVSPRAWSGWWWPMLDAPGMAPHLYDENGPLAKYDRLAQASGQPNPGTRDWAYKYMRTTDSANNWWGYCNGWAAASILEPEPTRESVINGVPFTVADKKGLLTSWYQSTGTRFQFGGREGLSALLFHRAILDWVVERGLPLIINTYTVKPDDYQVWNYPLVRARLAYVPDAAAADVTHVAATVWLASDAVPAGYLGTQLWPSAEGLLYTYSVVGDPGNPTAATWEGTSAGPGSTARPSMVWYPDPTWRYSPPLTPPGLDYATVQRIARDGGAAQ